ncbi:sensor histidine kinase [Actinoplanes palleronii]|uniref:histidine kinase n=1 Tax=Actinoplanes palleronii TaxID=113570 RepID=A0ABQ4BNQ3_9ACTN|nr:ATP-binding protein [Actinoplanes palleronii]GIE72313.1 two-component sensor histidine kinase [Actinoplanes palleronii]
MKSQSPARRIMVVCTAAFLFGVVVVWLSDVLLFWLSLVGEQICGPAGARGELCQVMAIRTDLQFVVLVCLIAVVLPFGARWAVRWCLRPIRELEPVIASVGPQNLGYRINAGTGNTEITVLARAIDEMMDRIAMGYEAQRHFAANASHELRTPLAVQRTLIEVGLARATTPEKLDLVTAQLLESNERNERLIEGLLVLSESDRGLVTKIPLRLDEITETVLADHEVRAAEAGLTINRKLTPRVVLGERVLLERLIINLVQNAIKYNRPGGSIDVEIGDQPALTVTNTGDDVPPEAVSGLFEPFRRLGGTRIDHSGGSGLGLTIARSICRAHDGAISAHSSGRDGLRVEIVFPAERPR